MRAFGRMHATDYSGKLTPDAIIDAVSRVMPKDTPIVTDVGAAPDVGGAEISLCTAAHLPDQRRYFGTMGFGMGAANGACIGTGRKNRTLYGGRQLCDEL